MAMETKDKVFKSELVMMSLQPAASNAVKSTPNGTVSQEEETSQQASLQLKSPNKIKPSSNAEIEVGENDSVKVQRCSESSVQGEISIGTERFEKLHREITASQIEVNLTSKTSVTSGQALSTGNVRSKYQTRQIDSDFPSNSIKSVSKVFEGGRIDGKEKKPRDAHGNEQGEESAVVSLEEKLVLPVGIQDLLDGDLESDITSEYSDSNDEEDIGTFSLGDKLELPLGIQELIDGDFKEKSNSNGTNRGNEGRKSVSNLKDLFADKIEEASGRRSSIGSDITDVTLSSDGSRSRSGSVSSGRVAIPDGIKELISGGNSVRNKVGAFEVKASEPEMEVTKLSPRDKIDVDFVGKKFKQIQKSMKSTSEINEKPIQKPIVPAVGINNKIKAFEKSVQDDGADKALKGTNTSSRKPDVKLVTDFKTKQQVAKFQTEMKKEKSLDSKDKLKQPPSAQKGQSKVISDNANLTNEVKQSVKAAQKSEVTNPSSPKQREVPLVQKLLLDVVKDIRQDVQKQEENEKLLQKTKADGSHGKTEKIISITAEEENRSHVSESMKRHSSGISQESLSSRDENCSVIAMKLESPNYTKPSQDFSVKKRVRVRPNNGTGMSTGDVRSVQGSDNTEPRDKGQQAHRDEVQLQAASAAKGDEITPKRRSRSSAPLTTPIAVNNDNEQDRSKVKKDEIGVLEKSNTETVKGSEKIPKKPRVRTISKESIDTGKEEPPKTPTSPSKSKVAMLTSALTSDSQVKKKKREDLVIEPKVSKLANVINSDPESLKNKSPKSPTKQSNTSSQSSVFNLIKKMQKSDQPEKETTRPKGKVKISPKFDVEVPEETAFSFKTISTEKKSLNCSSVEDKNEEMSVGNDRSKEVVEKGSVEIQKSNGSVKDGNKPKVSIPEQTSSGGIKKDANDNYKKLPTEKESNEKVKQNRIEQNNHKQEDAQPQFISSDKTLENPKKKPESLIMRLKSKLGGKSTDHNHKDEKNHKKSPPTENTMPAQKNKEAIEDPTVQDFVLLSMNDTECAQVGETPIPLKISTEHASKTKQVLNPTKGVPIVDQGREKLTETNTTESTEGSDMVEDIVVTEGNKISAEVDCVIGEKNLQNMESDSIEEVADPDVSGKEISIDTVSSFTKHELFFSSSEDITEHKAEDANAADFLKQNMAINVQLSDTVSAVNDAEVVQLESVDQKENKADLIEHMSQEKLSNIIKNDLQRIENFDMEGLDNESYNSLSTSTISLDSIQSPEMKAPEEVPLFVSASMNKSSGNKMSKPEFVQQYEQIEKLNELLENKENIRSLPQNPKTIDITVFEALKSKYSALQRRHEQTEMDLMQARLVATAIENEFDEDDIDGDSIYRQKYEKLKREMEFMKKKLEQQHEEEIEKKDAIKKQMERKLTEMMTDNEEQKRHVANLKRKSQRLNSDMQDMKLHLEEQVSRNSDLEKKQRKFDTEVQKVNTVLLQEKQSLNKTQKERDEIISERFTLEQQLKNVKLEYELQTEKLQRLEKQLQEISSAGNKDDKELITLKRLKADLESKLQEQEEELDEQAGVIQQLEQTKLRLEMNKEKLRQEHNRELEEKEQEMEMMRASSQKKLKSLESQLEEEYSEKQAVGKEKRELERKLKELNDLEPELNRDVEHRLRRNLKRTKALWRDAQMMLEKQKDGAGGKAIIKQLRNQLEDAEIATAAAVKARKGFEMEISELQQQLDDISKSKQETEERYMALSREKNDIQSQLDDHEEEYAELMKKYKAAIAQQSVDQMTIQEQSHQIEELQLEKEQLKEQLASIQSQVEFMQTSMVDKQLVVRLESKVRDLESKLELEHTTRHRAEVTVSRLKEQLEKLTEEKDKLNESEQRNTESNKRLSRQLRDMKDELADVQRHEGEATQRKHDLEKKVESLEGDFEQSQPDLRLAFKRIADLQAVMEDDIDSDLSDLDSDGEFGGDSDTDSSLEMPSFLVNHKSAGGSRRAKSSTSSGDTSIQAKHTSNGHDSSLLEHTSGSTDS